MICLGEPGSNTGGRSGRLEYTLNFAERHSFRLSRSNYGRTTSNSELKPAPVYKICVRPVLEESLLSSP